MTPSACSTGSGWNTLYYYKTTNTSYHLKQLIFTYPVNKELVGPGVNITNITIRGYVRNSSSLPKKLQFGFRPEANSGVGTWATYNGAKVLDVAFQAAPASNGASYKYIKPSRTYSESTSSSTFQNIAGHLKERFSANKPLYLGVIQPQDGRSISVNTDLSYWKIDVTYELLGNIPSNDVSEATLDTTKITTTINKILPGSSTKLTYVVNGKTVHTQDLGAGTTAVYTPPGTIGAHFPNSISATMTITAETFLNGTSYGRVSSSVILKLPKDAAPTCTASPQRIWKSGIASGSQVNAYIQGVSGVKFTLSGAGKFGSTITGYRLSIEGKHYTGTVASHLPIAGSGKVAFSYTVTDSRGLERTYSGTIDVLPWSAPKITQFDITRVDANGTEAIDGTYARVNIRGSATSIIVDGTQKNRLNYRVDYREIAAEGAQTNKWVQTNSVTIDGLSLSFSGMLKSGATLVGGGGVDASGANRPFNDMAGYEFRCVVTDIYASSQANDSMPTKEQFWDIDEQTGNMGFGGDAPTAAEKNVGYRFHRPVDMPKGLTVNGRRYGWYPGDSLVMYYNCRFPGHITNSSKGIYFSIYTGMPIYAQTATVSGRVVVRGVKGYVDNMNVTTGQVIPASGWTLSVNMSSKAAGIVCVDFIKDTAMENVTNNTPITVHPINEEYLVITFS